MNCDIACQIYSQELEKKLLVSFVGNIEWVCHRNKSQIVWDCDVQIISEFGLLYELRG